jgi:hypothetical protein
VYRSMIGSLLYLTVTRLNIQFSVCMCTCFQASPKTSHRHFAGCRVNRKSTSGTCQLFGSSLVSWSSRK